MIHLSIHKALQIIPARKDYHISKDNVNFNHKLSIHFRFFSRSIECMIVLGFLNLTTYNVYTLWIHSKLSLNSLLVHIRIY